jgi:hypothetical protein
MIGKDENQEEVSFTVADKRKFNPDGSLKEGVSLEAKPPMEFTPVATELPKPGAEPVSESIDISDIDLDKITLDDNPANDESEDLKTIPGADDPASFVNFLSTLATNAAASLGAVPHPATGKLSLDLETGKYWLDVLGMIKDKTAGNLHPQEARLLDGLLGDLRLQYVQLVRATEEKLKAQAAAKFSGDDILGKK